MFEKMWKTFGSGWELGPPLILNFFFMSGLIFVCFQEMGKDFSEEELARMIELGDVDGDGVLNYEEFIETCF